MLTTTLHRLSPPLNALWRRTLTHWTQELPPHLSGLGQDYLAYAQVDSLLPRPVLALVGAGHDRPELPESLVEELGPLALVPQVIRDFFAIHDDIVDGDTEKFGHPTLPEAFRHRIGAAGHGAALFWGDLLLSLIRDLMKDAEPRTRAVLWDVVIECVSRTQHGQLQELLWQREVGTITTEAVLRMYRDKAGDYCYGLPWRIGHAATGADPDQRETVARVLETIGTASQIVDDLATGCPDLMNAGKDDAAEIRTLRRTLILIELHQRLPADHRLRQVIEGEHATDEQAEEIRRAFVTTGAARAAAHTAAALVETALQDLSRARLGAAAHAYITDLAHQRVLKGLRPVLD
ncbi:polyprenyl synthetase family protein [Nocardiopsis metallicus]|uniref:Geranylgeranyl pyrophosphate synthase n=1 Tax=Nocardiopsis metallicus TaxID=179819 RepID=A0A840W865_9ACTN|nr:polyprenyl synthetase family protein [Nocardiopsis metallicus]MBB5492222.1 geranylgeranyl pyrophosphate synthase [Nocardiopsis metallicus]